MTLPDVPGLQIEVNAEGSGTETKPGKQGPLRKLILLSALPRAIIAESHTLGSSCRQQTSC
jgi:hypothetical protein